MTQPTQRRFCLLATCLLTFFTLACESKSQQSSSTNGIVATKTNSATKALPADLFASKPIANARGVAEVKSDETASGDVVITGRVGGRAEPFVDGAAVFILTDSALKSCDQIHGDKCQQPWDYCCETRESLIAHTATIRVTDADGKPIPLNIKDERGLSPLATVTIAGTISTNKDNQLVIDAKQIYVEGESKS